MYKSSNSKLIKNLNDLNDPVSVYVVVKAEPSWGRGKAGYQGSKDINELTQYSEEIGMDIRPQGRNSSLEEASNILEEYYISFTEQVRKNI